MLSKRLAGAHSLDMVLVKPLGYARTSKSGEASRNKGVKPTHTLLDQRFSARTHTKNLRLFDLALEMVGCGGDDLGVLGHEGLVRFELKVPSHDALLDRKLGETCDG